MMNEGNPLRRMMMGRQGTRGGRPPGTRQGQGMTPQPQRMINPQLAPMMKNPHAGRAFPQPGLGQQAQINAGIQPGTIPGAGAALNPLRQQQPQIPEWYRNRGRFGGRGVSVGQFR